MSAPQANALRLKHEVHEREAAVDRAYLRLQAGQSPDEAIEQQWQQHLRQEQQQKEASLKKVISNILHALISISITTCIAEWRGGSGRDGEHS